MEALESLVERLPGSIFLEFDFRTDKFKLGHSSGESLGMGGGGLFGSADGLSLVHPDDINKVRKLFETDMRTKSESEIRHRMLVNGEVRYFHSFFNTHFDESGRATKIYAIARDITKEIELQEELERSNAMLQAKNQSYREIVHDLKSPIANIEAISNLLDLKSKASNEEELNLLLALKASADQVNQMIQELNSLEHLSNDQEELGLEARSFPEYLKSIHPTLSIICERKSNRLKLECSDNFELLIHPPSFQRIFQNLVENAVKFSKPLSQITIGCKPEGGSAVLYVQDQGIGIPEENIPLLFNRKAKEKNRTGTSGELSTGLGLAIVKQVIDLHRGEIWVESKIEEGSRFNMRFPQA